MLQSPSNFNLGSFVVTFTKTLKNTTKGHRITAPYPASPLSKPTEHSDKQMLHVLPWHKRKAFVPIPSKTSYSVVIQYSVLQEKATEEIRPIPRINVNVSKPPSEYRGCTSVGDDERKCRKMLPPLRLVRKMGPKVLTFEVLSLVDIDPNPASVGLRRKALNL
ncbi:hypothetical protein CEXT_60901 [Caerostris extrusa]|uniref:Uncharacterized protein n=1 Tax=Caerostris extrusa TaxID=172846 RepID=A0AAV4MFH6_CAEEX|nr:hypothetical protein CEXT_60901 [Caerostris extrusa]